LGLFLFFKKYVKKFYLLNFIYYLYNVTFKQLSKQKQNKTKTIMANLNPIPVAEKDANKVKVVSELEIRNILFAIKGATPATILTHTEARMRKTNNPYYKLVVKRQWHNIFLNANYEKSVNRQRIKEGVEMPFIAQARKNGIKLPDSPIIYNTNTRRYYLSTMVLVSNRAEYLFDNQVIDKSLIENFLQASSSASNQGVDKEVVVRDFKMSSIQEVRVNGMVYIVTHTA
jgi:hypothetical protein